MQNQENCCTSVRDRLRPHDFIVNALLVVADTTISYVRKPLDDPEESVFAGPPTNEQDQAWFNLMRRMLKIKPQ